jgi:hypothetical protein
MSPQQLDVIVRVAGATLLLLAIATSRGRMTGGRAFFIPLAICLCGFLAGNSPDPRLQLGGPLGTVGVFLAGYAAVFLWWFCLAVFDAGFRPRGPVLWIGAGWILIASADRGLFGEQLAQAGLSWALVALGLIMVGHLTWKLLRDREGDLIDDRRRMRHVVVIALAGQLLADLSVDLVMGMEWRPHAFAIAQNAALLAFTVWLLRLTPPPPPPDAHVSAPEPRGDDVAADPALARLRSLLEVDRVHLDPELTFAEFVRAMGASERAVRGLINQHLGHEHFRTSPGPFCDERSLFRLGSRSLVISEADIRVGPTIHRLGGGTAGPRSGERLWCRLGYTARPAAHLERRRRLPLENWRQYRTCLGSSGGWTHQDVDGDAGRPAWVHDDASGSG